MDNKKIVEFVKGRKRQLKQDSLLTEQEVRGYEMALDDVLSLVILEYQLSTNSN